MEVPLVRAKSSLEMNFKSISFVTVHFPWELPGHMERLERLNRLLGSEKSLGNQRDKIASRLIVSAPFLESRSDECRLCSLSRFSGFKLALTQPLLNHILVQRLDQQIH